MGRKPVLWAVKSNFFFSDNPIDILLLRNEFRIYGNLISIWSKFCFKKIYVLFSLEEIFTGIEFGFIIIKKIKKKKFKELSLFSIKYFSNKKYNCLKYLDKNFLHSESQSEITTRIWRESIYINLKNYKIRYFKYYNKKKEKAINIYIQKKIFLRNIINKLNVLHFIKFKIFRNLWQRGFIITCGSKFGGTYLIYGGEINNVHASSSVLIIEKPFYSIPLELISYGRVGTITKKKSLLVSLLENLSINYIGLKWNKYLP